MNIFIQTDPNQRSIRYLCVGEVEDGKLTGFVYGYTGAGSFEKTYIYKGLYISLVDNNFNSISQSIIQDVFIKLVDLSTFDDLHYHLERFTDEVEGRYVLKDEVELDDDMFDDMEFSFTPPSFGNTTWKSTPMEFIDNDLIYEEAEIFVIRNSYPEDSEEVKIKFNSETTTTSNVIVKKHIPLSTIKKVLVEKQENAKPP